MSATTSTPPPRGAPFPKKVLGEAELRKLSQNVTEIIKASEAPADTEALRDLLHDLLDYAQAANLTLAHGAAALNALCAFLDRASLTDRYEVRAVVLNQSVWLAAFRVYVTGTDRHKSKPLRRLLETLSTLLLRIEDGEAKLCVLDHVATVCGQTLLGEISYAAVKPSFQVLEHLLRKNVFTPEFIVSRSVSPLVLANLSSAQAFYAKSLQWLQFRDCAPAVGRFVVTFIRCYDEQAEGAAATAAKLSIDDWLEPIKYHISNHPDEIERIESHVLTPLLSLLNADAGHLFNCQNLDDADVHVRLLTIRIPSHGLSSYHQDAMKFSLRFLDHNKATIRLASMTNVTTFLRQENLVDPEFHHRLTRCVQFFHQETSPNARNEFISIMTKLWCSIQKLESTRPLCSRPSRNRVTQQHKSLRSLDEEQHVAAWYVDYLMKELHPAGTYHGHFTALSMLCALSWQHSHTVGLSDLLTAYAGPSGLPNAIRMISRPLVDLLLNPFDDIREHAFILLRMLVRAEFDSVNESSTAKRTNSFISETDSKCSPTHSIILSIPKAEALFRRTGRAYVADGLAKLFNLNLLGRSGCTSLYSPVECCRVLIHRLQTDLDFAHSHSSTQSGSPLFGYFVTIRHLVSTSIADLCPDLCQFIQSYDFSQIVCRICSQVWQIVKPILCLDAPEGASSEDSISTSEKSDGQTLPLAWRALKESSELMQAVLSAGIKTARWDAIEFEAMHAAYGELAFTQLVELRHRGAFSTVSQTFATWCHSCIKSKDPDIQALPKSYHARALRLIQQKSGAITRRSAGLPAILAGTIKADDSEGLLEVTLSELAKIASQIAIAQIGEDMQLPQVHALNCSKDLFLDSQLGPQTQSHIASYLDLAADSLDSAIWAIRNSGLMLMRALINRLNHGTDMSSTANPSSHRRAVVFVYKQFPTLPHTILRLLRGKKVMSLDHDSPSPPRVETVFPALEIIERYGLPSLLREQIQEAVGGYMKSSVWALRDKAAKAFSSNVEEGATLLTLRTLLQPSYSSQNELHGRLLATRWLIRLQNNHIYANRQNSDVISVFDQAFDRLVTENPCPTTAATSLDVTADYLSILSRNGPDVVSRNLLDSWTLKVASLDCRNMNSSANVNLSMTRCRQVLSMDSSSNKTYEERKCDQRIIDNAPENEDHDLIEQGRCLGELIFVAISQASAEISPITQQRLGSWVKSLRYTCVEDSLCVDMPRRPCPTTSHSQFYLAETFLRSAELNSRLAAVDSIRKLLDQMLRKDEHSLDLQKNSLSHLLHTSTFFDFLVLLSDMLNDDDEDVRQGITVIVSDILHLLEGRQGADSRTRHVYSPPAARQYLLDSLDMIDGFASSLKAIAAKKVVGGPIVPEISLHGNSLRIYHIQADESLLPRLASVTRNVDLISTSNEIFEEERQNLYVDPVKAAETWLNYVDPDQYKNSYPYNQSYDYYSKLLKEAARVTPEDGALGAFSDAKHYLRTLFSMRAMLLLMNPSVDCSAALELPGERFRNIYRTLREKNTHPLLLRELEDYLKYHNINIGPDDDSVTV